ncbi:MAG: hypothetical protein RL291_1302 [Pseudomonadota bacterium]|jgi:RimJ/RimL family protein N-acetyltransferase
MPITIRQIEERDIEAFYAGLCTVIAEGRYLGFETPPPIDKTRAFITECIENDYPQLVAVDGEVLAGWCDVVPGGRSTMRHDGSLGMALLPDYRGKGLGERLIRAAIEASWAWGMTRISLDVFTTNPRAHALYLKVGFVDEGVRRRMHKFPDGYRDSIMMGLLKPDAAEPPV